MTLAQLAVQRQQAEAEHQRIRQERAAREQRLEDLREAYNYDFDFINSLGGR